MNLDDSTSIESQVCFVRAVCDTLTSIHHVFTDLAFDRLLALLAFDCFDIDPCINVLLVSSHLHRWLAMRWTISQASLLQPYATQDTWYVAALTSCAFRNSELAILGQSADTSS